MKRRLEPDERALLNERIAELEKQNAQLKVSEQLFHALFEQAGGYSLILDPNTPDGIPVIKAANKAACKYHGYPEEEFIGQPAGIVDDPEGKELVKKHTAMIMTGEPFYIENRHMRKDGSVFHVAVNARRIDLEGKPPLILSTEYDITERKEALLSLQANEEQFRLAIENMPCPVMIHAEGGEVLQVNRMWTDLSGYEYQEINTIEKWGEKIIARGGGALTGPSGSCQSILGEHIGEYEVLTRSGEHLFWDFYSSSIGELPDGRCLTISSAQDITESKKMQEIIVHSEKMKAIGELAGGIAHDFNNQLGVMMGYLELLDQKIENRPDLSLYFEEMFKSLEHSRKLTSQLLSFSRKGKNLHEIIDLRKVLESISLIMENSIDKRIQISKHFSSCESCLMGDPSQIHNAILNIAINGRDSMAEGGILSFALENIELDAQDIRNRDLHISPGKYALVTVSDTGLGMSREVRKKSIEPFFTTKEEGRGTGMGLSAAYGTLQAHKGALTIRSEVGKGSDIGLYFPLTTETAASAGSKDKTESFSGSGMVLFVDDNKELCHIGKLILSQMGYNTYTFSKPVEAIEFFRDHREQIKFVIIDMIMPEMNGSELFDQLKSLDKDVRVILTSGYSAEGDVKGLKERGVQEFLPKPFSMKSMKDTVERVMSRHQSF